MATSKIALYLKETVVSVFETSVAPGAAYLDFRTGGHVFSMMAPVLTHVLKVKSAVKNSLEHQSHKSHLAQHDVEIELGNERLSRLESEFLTSKTELNALAFDLKNEVEKIAMLVAGFSRSTGNAADIVQHVNNIESSNRIVVFGEGSFCNSNHLEGFQRRPQDYGKIIKPGEPYESDKLHIITGSESPQLVAMQPEQFAEILQSNKALIPFKLYGSQQQFIALSGPDTPERREVFSPLTFIGDFTPKAERAPNPEFPWEDEIPEPSAKIAELKSLIESLNGEIQQTTKGLHPSQASDRAKITEARKVESRARNELVDYPLLPAETKGSVEKKIRQNPAFRFSSFHVEHPDISDESLVAFTALVQKLIASESNQKILVMEYNRRGKEQIGILEGRVNKASTELAAAERSDLRNVLQKTLGTKAREQYPSDEMAVLLPHLKHRGYTFTKIKLHEEIEEFLDLCKQEADWFAIANTQSGKQLQAFITNHPKSDRAKEAKARIALLQKEANEREWNDIADSHDIERIQDFAKTEKHHVQEAIALARKLERDRKLEIAGREEYEKIKRKRRILFIKIKMALMLLVAFIVIIATAIIVGSNSYTRKGFLGFTYTEYPYIWMYFGVIFPVGVGALVWSAKYIDDMNKK